MQSRTHTCGELRMEHIGQKVQLAGWMENVREVGSSLAFVVVRDFYGKTQLVIEREDLLQQVKAMEEQRKRARRERRRLRRKQKRERLLKSRGK